MHGLNYLYLLEMYEMHIPYDRFWYVHHNESECNIVVNLHCLRLTALRGGKPVTGLQSDRGEEESHSCWVQMY